MQRSTTRILCRDSLKDQKRDVKHDAWLLAPAIRVQESAKNPSRHELKDIARVVLQTQKRKKKKNQRKVERRKASSSERSARGTWTHQVHMTRKTGEDQLLVQAVPMLQQRKTRKPGPQCLGGPIRTACSRARARAAARRGWLCTANQHAKVRRRRDINSRRRWLLLAPQIGRQCADGSAAPGYDATNSLQAHRQTPRRAGGNC